MFIPIVKNFPQHAEKILLSQQKGEMDEAPVPEKHVQGSQECLDFWNVAVGLWICVKHPLKVN